MFEKNDTDNNKRVQILDLGMRFKTPTQERKVLANFLIFFL